MATPSSRASSAPAATVTVPEPDPGVPDSAKPSRPWLMIVGPKYELAAWKSNSPGPALTTPHTEEMEPPTARVVLAATTKRRLAPARITSV